MRRWPLVVAVGLGFVAYTALARLHATEGTLRGHVTPTTMLWYLVAFTGFVLAIWCNERRALAMGTIWIVAIAFRLVVLTTEPTLSDDVYRYLWEGHVASEGVSPYDHPVDAEELDNIAIPIRDLVNHPGLASPYLPTAHIVFAGVAVALPADPLSIQVVMVIAELTAAMLLVTILRAVGLPDRRVLVFLWNPLVILEVAHGAHLDALMLLLVMAAIAASLGSGRWHARWPLAPLALAAATLTRPLPLLVVPVIWFCWNNRQRALFVVAVSVPLVPFAITSGWGLGPANTGTGVFGSARVYSETFEFNSSTYYAVRDLVGHASGDASATARVLIGTIMVAVLARVAHSASKITLPLDAVRLMAVPIGTYVILTPILHPWYLVLLAGFLPMLAPGPAEARRLWFDLAPWIYLSATVSLSYLTYRNPGIFAELRWVRRIEWYPTYAILAGLSVARLRRQAASRSNADALTHRVDA